MSRFRTSSRRLLIVMFVIPLVLGGLAYTTGIPYPNSFASGKNISCIIVGRLDRQRLFDPYRKIQDPEHIDILTAAINGASCRLEVPTIGTIGGDALLLMDTNDQVIGALIWQSELNGVYLVDTDLSDGKHHLGDPQMLAFGLLNRVYKVNLIKLAKQL